MYFGTAERFPFPEGCQIQICKGAGFCSESASCFGFKSALPSAKDKLPLQITDSTAHVGGGKWMITERPPPWFPAWFLAGWLNPKMRILIDFWPVYEWWKTKNSANGEWKICYWHRFDADAKAITNFIYQMDKNSDKHEGCCTVRMFCNPSTYIV